MNQTIAKEMDRLISLPAYTPASGRGGRLRLDANEGPAPPSGLVRRLLAGAADVLTYYPEYDDLRRAWSGFFGVSPGALMPLNGADEGIRLVMQAWGRPGTHVLTVRPTFAMYRIYAAMAGAAYREVPLGADFSMDLPRLLAAVPKADLVVLASPNNPTGRRIPKAELRQIMAAADGRPVLLDETYAEFCGQNFIPWLERFPNLLILRTLSKSRGLPGLRCGFLLGAPDLIRPLDALRSPYNVTAVSARVAVDVLREDPDFVIRLRAAVAAREWLQSELAARGVICHPSDTHFFLLQLDCRRAASLSLFLENRQILVKRMGTVLPGCLRVSVADSDQAAAFLRAFTAWSVPPVLC
jgi:histidinol-phosphate aminotransferase